MAKFLIWPPRTALSIRVLRSLPEFEERARKLLEEAIAQGNAAPEPARRHQ